MNGKIFTAACWVVWVSFSFAFKSLSQPNKNDKAYLYFEDLGEKKIKIEKC